METTLEKVKKNNIEKTVSSLQDLLKRTYDAEAGYRKAMELAKDENLTTFLKRRAAQRAEFATELDRSIRKFNEEPVDSGSIKADMHRSWMNIKAFISNTTDEAILEECIRGEKASLDAYVEAITENSFSPEITNMLNDQMLSIRKSVDEVKKLEITENVVHSI